MASGVQHAAAQSRLRVRAEFPPKPALSQVIHMADAQNNYTPPDTAAANANDTSRVSWDEYQEARFGPLPPDTFRILDCGSPQGWHFELELIGKAIVLKEPGRDISSAYAVHENRQRADELARLAIAANLGREVAQRAQFKVVWGGTV